MTTIVINIGGENEEILGQNIAEYVSKQFQAFGFRDNSISVDSITRQGELKLPDFCLREGVAS